MQVMVADECIPNWYYHPPFLRVIPQHSQSFLKSRGSNGKREGLI